MGIDPYPAGLFPINARSEEIRKDFDPETGNFQDICMAGRLMSVRVMGKAAFAELQDSDESSCTSPGTKSAQMKIKTSIILSSKNCSTWAIL